MAERTEMFTAIEHRAHTETNSPRLPKTRSLILAGAILVAAAATAAPEESGSFHAWLELAERRTLLIPQDADAVALVDDPSEIGFEIDADPGDDAFMAVSSDVHGVYRVSFASLAETIADLDSHEDFVPHVDSSEARQVDEDRLEWLQHVELSFGFLFFNVDYAFENRHVVMQLDDDRFALVFRMNETYDDLVADIYGSWYLERLVVDGDEYVYVRYFNHVVFGRRVTGLRFAVRSFGLRDAKNAMRAYVNEARARPR